jgi:serine/threonine protein kinase
VNERLPTGEWSPPPGEESIGLPTISGYEIQCELGRGGMGVVYQALETKTNRIVALKLIRDGALAGPHDRARFRIEAEAAARIRHPNVVQIYEVGDHLGTPYYAMELVHGRSLDRVLADGPFDMSRAAELVRTLADAVQQAHDQHIIHRDLKPANILVADFRSQSEIRNPQSEIKITDFGLAKRLDSESTAWTQVGAVLGTASYMAPEQAAGRIDEVGPPADIYALGAVLYELLTGRPPFLAETWNETIDQVLHAEPAPPSRLRAHVPAALETICLKCLEKSPNRRYGSARELADDLARCLQGEPIVAVPTSEIERLSRLAAREGFQITGEIGCGPRCTTYRATFGPMRQSVALKVFCAELATREDWESRLERAAQKWMALTHPNVILPQRTGWLDRAPYIAAEFVPQGSLESRLKQESIPIRQALVLVEQLAEIVSYVHRQGAVHGNLKPSNVLFAADGNMRLTDFYPTGGLSMGSLPPAGAPAPGLAFLAPELAFNDAAEPTPNADTYGLGAILYELLARRPPFAAESAAQMLELVRAESPTPLTQINSRVSPELDLFCLRCLRKNPWRRSYRIYDLAIRLREFQEYTSGSEEIPARRLKRRPRR